jgi:hypothetical protein
VAQSEYDRLAHDSNPDYDRYLMQLGAYQACERATRIVDDILDKVKDDDDRTESRRQHAADHRQLVTYGTPFWKPNA